MRPGCRTVSRPIRGSRSWPSDIPERASSAQLLGDPSPDRQFLPPRSFEREKVDVDKTTGTARPGAYRKLVVLAFSALAATALLYRCLTGGLTSSAASSPLPDPPATTLPSLPS